MTPLSDEQLFRAALEKAPAFDRRGRVVWALGGILKATGVAARIGQTCNIVDFDHRTSVPAEVVGLCGDTTILSPLKPIRGLSLGAEVTLDSAHDGVACGDGLLGRILDGLGEPIDGLGALQGPLSIQEIYAPAPGPLDRKLIRDIFPTGVRTIDALLTIGVGQRTGIFATAGAGKSTLLGMVGRGGRGDVNVIALIGERGREVGEFIEHALGAEGLRRSVIVVATSDRPAIERVRAANVATAIAEGFSRQGKHVVLMMDSVTRYARALREIGLAAGEPAVRRGFPPSVFAELPRLFERAGSFNHGSITAFYTVLLEEAEEGADPIGEEVRSILDGHIHLSRKIGEGGRYPAIDVLASISRLFNTLAKPSHGENARKVRAWLSKYADIELLLQIGEYERGNDSLADESVQRMPLIERFLTQTPTESADLETAFTHLAELIA